MRRVRLRPAIAVSLAAVVIPAAHRRGQWPFGYDAPGYLARARCLSRCWFAVVTKGTPPAFSEVRRFTA